MKKHPSKESLLDADRLGRARGAEHPSLDQDVLAVDGGGGGGRLPGSGSDSTKLLSGKSPEAWLPPLAPHPGRERLPRLYSKEGKCREL